ncbi:MAG: methyltransferase domain-containing protein, partial [Gemmatimonadales bacterium]
HVPTMFDRVAATFATLPFADRSAHLAIFNAALHYADDLACALREAARVVRAGGHLVILDSPCYEDAADGEAMLREKRAKGAARFGADAPVLLAPAYVEFLTPARLAAASEPHGLVWRRHRVRYPLWYELRPWIARWRGRRAPSRFDLWTAEVP